ncbi:hypothetical protein ACMFMF_005271 [Clarireedia jacksonii]
MPNGTSRSRSSRRSSPAAINYKGKKVPIAAVPIAQSRSSMDSDRDFDIELGEDLEDVVGKFSKTALKEKITDTTTAEDWKNINALIESDSEKQKARRARHAKGAAEQTLLPPTRVLEQKWSAANPGHPAPGSGKAVLNEEEKERKKTRKAPKEPFFPPPDGGNRAATFTDSRMTKAQATTTAPSSKPSSNTTATKPPARKESSSAKPSAPAAPNETTATSSASRESRKHHVETLTNRKNTRVLQGAVDAPEFVPKEENGKKDKHTKR